MRARGHGDLRQLVAWLNEVEVCLVGGEVSGDFGVGDVDLGLDFFVDQLVLGEGAANVALEIVKGHIALLELIVELLLRVWRLELGDLGVNILIGGGKV